MYKHEILNGLKRLPAKADGYYSIDVKKLIRHLSQSIEISIEETSLANICGPKMRSDAQFERAPFENVLLTFSHGKILGQNNVHACYLGDIGSFDTTAYITIKLYRYGNSKLNYAIESMGYITGDGQAVCVLNIEDKKAEMPTSLWMAHEMLRILNCKNVTVEKQPAAGTERDRKRTRLRGEYAPFEYYVLEINPLSAKSRTDTDESDPTGIKHRMHLCRGHFSTYTEEKPLFGKYVGRYWIPSHVRGSAELGLIDKDYRVKVTP